MARLHPGVRAAALLLCRGTVRDTVRWPGVPIVPFRPLAGPRGLPLLGNLPAFGSDPLVFLERLRDGFGDVVTWSLGRCGSCPSPTPSTSRSCWQATKDASRFSRPAGRSNDWSATASCAARGQAATRRALAALDPEEFPVLTGHLAAILPAMIDHEVYFGGLRQLIHAADPTRTDKDHDHTGLEPTHEAE